MEDEDDDKGKGGDEGAAARYREMLAEERRKRSAAESKLAERQAKEDELAAEQERQKGEFDKILARERKQLEELKKENEELRGFRSATLADKRRSKVAAQIAGEAGLQPDAVLRGLIREAESEGLLEIPEDGLVDVKKAIKDLSKLAPSVFTPNKEGTNRPPPANAGAGGGSRGSADPSVRDKWMDWAKNFGKPDKD